LGEKERRWVERDGVGASFVIRKEKGIRKRAREKLGPIPKEERQSLIRNTTKKITSQRKRRR